MHVHPWHDRHLCGWEGRAAGDARLPATSAHPSCPPSHSRAVPTAWYVRHRREEARRGILIGGGDKEHAETARAGKAKVVSRVASLIQQQEADAAMLRATASSLGPEHDGGGRGSSFGAVPLHHAPPAPPATYHRVPVGSGATRLPVLSSSKVPPAAADAVAGRHQLLRLISTPALGASRPSRVPARAGAKEPMLPADAVEKVLGGLQVEERSRAARCACVAA